VTGTLGQDHPIENLLELDGDVYVIDEVEGYWVKFMVVADFWTAVDDVLRLRGGQS
jgi:hypothetical protein